MVKVLIVEDNEAIIKLIMEILEKDGSYDVKTAHNGVEGYAAFRIFNPDIILTDIEMPRGNGLEMIRNIRLLHPRVKTIYMSADLNRYRSILEEEKTRYKARLLNKPFSSSMMIGLFHEYQKERR